MPWIVLQATMIPVYPIRAWTVGNVKKDRMGDTTAFAAQDILESIAKTVSVLSDECSISAGHGETQVKWKQAACVAWWLFNGLISSKACNIA